MNEKSYRIKMDLNNPQETNIKIDLKNNIDELNFLTLKLTQEEIYQSTNADFGVVVGRVIANDGVGLPNAKISIFIPIDEEDKNNPDIVSIYPYESPLDENKEGKRYNLLDRVSVMDEYGFYKPKQPFGSFPSKIETLSNETNLQVYEKYYKYNTLTNEYGDYILFGIPIGTQTLHLSVDITDIGEYSMNPMQMINNLGYSPNLFSSDGFYIKEQKRLVDLPHIETQDIDINVTPFWGDDSLSTIGIVRQDFNVKATINTSTIIFGSLATMGENCYIGSPTTSGEGRKDRGFKILSPNVYGGSSNTMTRDIRTLRCTKNIKFRVYSYRNTIPQNIINKDISNNGNEINTRTDIYELSENEYSIYTDDEGFFVLNINCNYEKIIKNDEGVDVIVDVNDRRGVFTKFRGMFTVEIEDDVFTQMINMGDTYTGKAPVILTRGKLKFPQSNDSLRDVSGNEEEKRLKREESERWRKRHFTLEMNKYYSIAQFFPTQYINNGGYSNTLKKDDLLESPTMNISGLVFKIGGEDIMGDYEYKYNKFNNEFNYINIDDEIEEDEEETEEEINFKYLFPHNKTTALKKELYFGGQWMNMFCVLPQFSYTTKIDTRKNYKRDKVVLSYLTGDKQVTKNNFFVNESVNNNQHLMGDEYGTLFYLRGDVFKTDIIEVSKNDIDVFRKIKREINIGQSNEMMIEERAFNIGKINDITDKSKYKKATNGYDEDSSKSPYAFTGMGRKSILTKLVELNII